MVRRVDSEIILGGEIGQQLHNVVNAGVVVLFDRVRFDERIDTNNIDLVIADRLLEVVGEAPAHLVAALVERHEFSASGSRGRQEQPTLQFLAINAVMQTCRENAAAKFFLIVFEGNNQDATTLKYMLACE